MKRRLKSYFYLSMGIFFLILAIIGVVLPLLPTTPFLILTALCFNRGSEKFHKWLMEHKIFSPPILDWQKNGIIRLKYKVFASLMLLGSGIYILLKPTVPALGLIIYVTFAVCVLVFIWTRPEKKVMEKK